MHVVYHVRISHNMEYVYSPQFPNKSCEEMGFCPHPRNTEKDNRGFGWAWGEQFPSFVFFKEAPAWLHETETCRCFRLENLLGLPSAAEQAEPFSQDEPDFCPAACVFPALTQERVPEWFVEPLMEKEDTLNHECQKLKLNFRIYSWSKLPFALLKCRWISAEAMEPLKAPINLVSEEEAKAWRPLAFYCGAQEPPRKPWDVRFQCSGLPEAGGEESRWANLLGKVLAH